MSARANAFSIASIMSETMVDSSGLVGLGYNPMDLYQPSRTDCYAWSQPSTANYVPGLKGMEGNVK